MSQAVKEGNSSNHSSSAPPLVPDYRIGDLLWCRERNGKIWWPAMVTYDPNLGVYYRLKTPHRILHYHVQYFGISAIRGWVSSKAVELVNSPSEKLLPEKGFTSKLRSEYQVALKEVKEAYSLDYKERKLRFIFSFNPPPRSKRPRKESLSSSSRASLLMEPAGANKSAPPSAVASETKRTSEKNENVKPLPNVTRTTVITSAVAPQQQKSTKTNDGGSVLHQGASSLPQVTSESSNRVPSTSKRKRSSSERPTEQVAATLNGTSNQRSTSKKRQDNNIKCVVRENPGRCDCPDCVRSTSQVAKKLRCSSPPVESQTLNINTELNKSATVPLEVCRQQQQQQQQQQNQQMQTVQPQPHPAYYIQPAFTTLGGIPYQTCMYMSLQYASLWPSPGGMAAAAASPAAALAGQNPQLYTRLNMLCFDPQRQLLSDSLHNSRILPYPALTPPSLPSSSFTTSALLSPPTVTPLPPAHQPQIEMSPPIVPLSPTVTRPQSSVSSPPPPPPPPPQQLTTTTTTTDDELPVPASTSKRPRRSNVRYGSGVVRRQSSNASSVDASSESPLLVDRPTLHLQEKKAPSTSSLELVAPEVTSLSAGSTATSISASSQSITSAILTPPTSSSEDSPSVDLDFERPAASSLPIPPTVVSSSDHLTASSSEETDSSSKPEVSRKRKRNHKQVMEKDESTFKSGVCSICDGEDTDLLVCGGHCYRMFHLDCLGLMFAPDFKFVCDECLLAPSKCFACGKSSGEVIKCSKARCSKLYHLSCIEGNRLFSFDEKKTKSFTCPLHVCARCESIGGVAQVNHSNLLQCTQCPLALHKPDCLIAGCELVSQTHMVCYQHMKITKNSKLYSHLNLNTCFDCGATGSLFCCDVCSAAYHMECLDEVDRPVDNSDSWKCPNCAVHDLPVYGSLVLCKFGVWRWWPCEVILPASIPDNIIPKKPGEGMFVVRFCGSQDFAWTYHGRTVPYTENYDIGQKPHRKPKSTDASFKKACDEAKQLYQLRKTALEARRYKPDLNNHYTKIKANKYLVPRPLADQESLDFLACQCTSEHPCNDDSTCVNRAIHIECDPRNCPVGTLCQNQRMQKCQNSKTAPFYTGTRGWGLKTEQDLSSGDFVIEYIGEILDMEMCKERIKKAHENHTNNFYMLTLDQGLIIDAGQKSNHARFINHSCNPNCETRKWRVKGESRIGIFANQDIKAGTELTFDYHLDSLGNEMKKCLCGSKNCSGFLGVKSIKVVSSSEPSRIKAKAKKRRKSKPMVKKEMKEEDQVDTHEDDCFICNDGGSLLLCERKDCPKAYHLECLGRKLFPPKSQKWECPVHFCQVCQKASSSFCSSCPVSYCSKHCGDKFFRKPDSEEQVCYEVCHQLLEQEKEVEDSSSTTESESSVGSV